MARFYTKKGDDGYTGLLGEGRAPKFDPRIEAIGAVDEANAALALARSSTKVPETGQLLLEVQKDLYLLMAELAATAENAAQFRKITDSRIEWLESHIDRVTHKVSIPKDFILPGDTFCGAAVDAARTIVRRAERHIARLLLSNTIENQSLLRYMNRLSSLLFVLELLEDQASGIDHPTLAKE